MINKINNHTNNITMSHLENSSPFNHEPILGEVVKICEIGTLRMIDGSEKPYSEKFFVSIKELPTESNDYTYSGIVSNKLIYSKQEMGSIITFKHKHIIEMTGRVHSYEVSEFYINLLKRNPELLRMFQKIAVKKM